MFSVCSQVSIFDYLSITKRYGNCLSFFHSCFQFIYLFISLLRAQIPNLADLKIVVVFKFKQSPLTHYQNFFVFNFEISIIA